MTKYCAGKYHLTLWKFICLLAFSLMFPPPVTAGEETGSIPVYLDETASADARIEDALGRMSLAEKIALIHADSKFTSPGVPRLGIPPIHTDDGPQGVREESLWDDWASAGQTNDSCTAYPALMSLTAAWNTELAYRYGRSIGEEFRYRGKDVALTPGININRHPYCGRNFEYMGEDPCLVGEIAAGAIKGIQSNGVAACVKHFALNNQEADRHMVDVVVSDRALHEIYLPAFKRAVEAGVWSVMGAYNKYKGEFCCHNQYLNKILKWDWGFDGVMISDWGATEDTRQAARNGLDLEFGTHTNGLDSNVRDAYDDYYLAEPYRRMIEGGELEMSGLDDKARRVLRLCFRTNMNRSRPFGSLNSPEHSADALAIQHEGIVLLKNERNILPLLTPRKGKTRVLVVGENADFMLTKWGGSSNVKARYEITPLAALIAKAPGGIEINYSKGYTSDWPPSVEMQDSLRLAAIEAAKTADIILFIGGHNKYPNHDNEGTDRTDTAAPFRQGELLEILADMKAPVVLITMGANQFDMPYSEKIPAMLHCWYGGSENGNALADIVYGNVNPSGKLPVTFYKTDTDCGAIIEGEYPGDGDTVRYNEDIFVGYRYTERNNIEPAFPFGHGLSYTSFRYGKPKADRSVLSPGETVCVEIPITNTGKTAGKEIVQLYIGEDNPTVPRPVKEVKGFCKLDLHPGETGTARFEITPADLSFYDVERKGWHVNPGSFTIFIGSSSADIRQSLKIRHHE